MCATLASCVRVLIGILPDLQLEKAVEGGLRAWAPPPVSEYQYGIPGSCLWSDLVRVAIWERINRLNISLSLSLHLLHK